MLNMLAWLLLGSPLIVTSMLMIRRSAKQRADVNPLRASQPRVEMPRHLSVDTTRSGFNDRYFSTSRNRDRAMTSR
jgi:hypothetical protein